MSIETNISLVFFCKAGFGVPSVAAVLLYILFRCASCSFQSGLGELSLCFKLKSSPCPLLRGIPLKIFKAIRRSLLALVLNLSAFTPNAKQPIGLNRNR